MSIAPLAVIVIIFICLISVLWLSGRPSDNIGSALLGIAATAGATEGGAIEGGAIEGGARGTAAKGAPPRRSRRPDPAKSPHIVVDGLNLTHWLEGHVSLDAVVSMIDRTAPTLAAAHPGVVFYVVKDRETLLNTPESREVLHKAAVRNHVTVIIAERYATDGPASQAHSARGRDDFYMSLLASRHRCAVVTADQLRDFGEFRTTIPPFHTVEYNYWKERPSQEYVKPAAAAYARLRKPRTIHPSEYFGDKKETPNPAQPPASLQ